MTDEEIATLAFQRVPKMHYFGLLLYYAGGEREFYAEVDVVEVILPNNTRKYVALFKEGGIVIEKPLSIKYLSSLNQFALIAPLILEV